MKCVICGTQIEDKTSHNAEPVKNGRCCKICNTLIVIPERMKNFLKGSDNNAK